MKLLKEFIVNILALLLYSFLMMWALHRGNEFDERVPAFGYWTCLYVLLAIHFAVYTALLNAGDRIIGRLGKK